MLSSLKPAHSSRPVTTLIAATQAQPFAEKRPWERHQPKFWLGQPWQDANRTPTRRRVMAVVPLVFSLHGSATQPWLTSLPYSCFVALWSQGSSAAATVWRLGAGARTTAPQRHGFGPTPIFFGFWRRSILLGSGTPCHVCCQGNARPCSLLLHHGSSQSQLGA